jgi:transcription termination/antitermination protein NusA
MNGTEVLRIVDAIHRDKNIDKEIVFEGVEQAILSAARKHFGEENDVIARDDGVPDRCDAWSHEQIPPLVAYRAA